MFERANIDKTIFIEAALIKSINSYIGLYTQYRFIVLNVKQFEGLLIHRH